MCGQRWLGPDPVLEFLLQMDGVLLHLTSGYQVKIEVRLISSTKEVPHGIRYNLVLLDKHNQRVLGFDNSHRVRTGKRRYGVWSETADHIHLKERTIPYEFVSPGQLLVDFWDAAENEMKDGEE